MRVFTLVLAAAAALLLPGMLKAAELADNEYVTRYFGTVARFTTPTQASGTSGWWGDSVPQELSYNYSYLAGVVNTRRMDKGITPLLNPNEALVTLGEEVNNGSSWTYSIEFVDMRPSEVGAIIEMLGGASRIVPGSTVSYDTLRRRYLYASAGPDGTATMNIGGREIRINLTGNGADARGQLDAALTAAFGAAVPYEMYLSTYKYFDGTTGADLSLTVDMDGGAAYLPADGMPQGE
jgi:hypothetical protein